MEYRHQPVMLAEVLEMLNPQPGEYFLDATLGGGGYTLSLAERVAEKGKVLGVDMDPLAIENIREIMEKEGIKNIETAHSNFSRIKQVSEERLGEGVRFQGIVFDLGLSSAQLEDENRGFSFQKDTPLDMSFGGEDQKGEKSSAGYIVNSYSFQELSRIFKELGEEKLSPRIAKKIGRASCRERV